MPTIIRLAGYVVIGALGLLVVVMVIARCMADLGSVPRGYIDVELVWHDYHAGEAEGDRRWKSKEKLTVMFHVDTIAEIEEANKVIVSVGSPQVGRVQLDFKNHGRPLNLQSIKDYIYAECWVGGMSMDSTLLLEECELN